jgi:hypothetical protein
MPTATKDYGKSMQLWPGGKSVQVRGEGKNMKIRYDRDGRWRKPNDAERREIRTEELAEMYQERDILHCDSMLVDELLKQGFEHHGEFFREWDMDKVVNYYADPSNWGIEECKDWLEDNGYDLPEDNPWSMTPTQLIDLLTAQSIDCKDDDTNEVLLAAVIANIDDETIDGLEDWRRLVEENTNEHPAEVYEWWRVSNWLAGKLKDIGQCVLDNDYGTWWGRQCTGQQFIMDGVLQRVAAQFAD